MILFFIFIFSCGNDSDIFWQIFQRSQKLLEFYVQVLKAGKPFLAVSPEEAEKVVLEQHFTLPPLSNQVTESVLKLLTTFWLRTRVQRFDTLWPMEMRKCYLFTTPRGTRQSFPAARVKNPRSSPFRCFRQVK